MEPATSEESAYIFGLSEAQVRAVFPLARAEFDEEGWLAFNRGAFRCENYGDLCRMIGDEAAESVTRNAFMSALDGAGLEEIVAAMDREIDAARIVYESHPLTRASNVGTIEYDCHNHRLRNETFKVNPAFGSRYGQVTCKLQTDLGSGIWGGSQTADDLEAFVEIDGTNENASSSQTDTHSITSPKVYPGANQTVRGICTGDHNGDVKTRTMTQS